MSTTGSDFGFGFKVAAGVTAFFVVLHIAIKLGQFLYGHQFPSEQDGYGGVFFRGQEESWEPPRRSGHHDNVPSNWHVYRTN